MDPYPSLSGRWRPASLNAAKANAANRLGKHNVRAFPACSPPLEPAHVDDLPTRYRDEPRAPVGDSLGQVIYGLDSSVPVTLDMMIAHGAAVVRGSYHAAVLVDLPFGTYEASPEVAFATAARVLKETGAAGVKLEGGAAMADTVAFLTARGIPVMGHVGLTPQAVNVLGGYNARGRSDAEADKIVSDAKSLDDAGAFAIVVEGVVEPIAVAVTRAVTCPTIGIGGSVECDGQVLVTEDMLGMFDRVPRFVKRYEDLAGVISKAAETYAAEVRSRSFPTVDQTYQPK
jgi:3-methyl-2-oxobutanoate hydroxymethyltransferase